MAMGFLEHKGYTHLEIASMNSFPSNLYGIKVDCSLLKASPRPLCSHLSLACKMSSSPTCTLSSFSPRSSYMPLKSASPITFPPLRCSKASMYKSLTQGQALTPRQNTVFALSASDLECSNRKYNFHNPAQWAPLSLATARSKALRMVQMLLPSVTPRCNSEYMAKKCGITLPWALLLESPLPPRTSSLTTARTRSSMRKRASFQA